MSKRARVKWYYHDKGDAGTFIRTGFVRNSEADCDVEGKYPHDCIRLQIRSHWKGQDDIDLLIRLDEASSIAAGLSLVAAKIADGTCGKRSLRRHAAAVESNSL